MTSGERPRWVAGTLLGALIGATAPGLWPTAPAQEMAPPPRAQAPVLPPLALPHPGLIPGDQPLPINLPTALRLADVQSLDIALAAQRTRLAVAQLDRAKVLWLPTIFLGGDYFRHDGQIQDVAGRVFGTSKSTLQAGVGPYAVFALTDAYFEPLAARQVVQARQAALRAAANDNLLAVAEAYFGVQQARGDLAGAEDALRRAEELVRKTDKLAPELVPPVEASRARTELARRKIAVSIARERWRIVGADLTRLLRLEASALIEPTEPPFLEISLVPPGQSVDDLVVQALTARPELAAQQALVQATVRRLREEKLRPLVPSVLLRGVSTNPGGTLSSSYFGGGINEHVGDFSFRNSMDLQLLWELQNLGFGNHARVSERRAEHDALILELFRLQDRIAAEVVQAYHQVRLTAARIEDAELGLREGLDSATKNIEGMSQTKRPGGNIVLLVIRPQEAVQSVQALAQAYTDYYAAIADYNRAQFRLYRALGTPGQALLQSDECPCGEPIPNSRPLPPTANSLVPSN